MVGTNATGACTIGAGADTGASNGSGADWTDAGVGNVSASGSEGGVGTGDSWPTGFGADSSTWGGGGSDGGGGRGASTVRGGAAARVT
ncbi:MAG TPA: hypothetical protein VK737_09185, partial [Opitutales bacterium]|nr:hypothetical protein [Opitutales bacterium]